jgi:hypothetical protein
MFLIAVSTALWLAGVLLLLVAAFRAGIAWGIGCLLLPVIVPWLFVITHWEQARRPFFLLLGGLAVGILGAIATGKPKPAAQSGASLPVHTQPAPSPVAFRHRLAFA